MTSPNRVRSIVNWGTQAIALALLIIAGSEVTVDVLNVPNTRLIVILTVGLILTIMAIWQIVIAQQTDGWPGWPPTFRWVMAIWLLAFALFVLWSFVAGRFKHLYSPDISVVMWTMLGQATLWFFRRWGTMTSTSDAGVGQTGTEGHAQ